MARRAAFLGRAGASAAAPVALATVSPPGTDPDGAGALAGASVEGASFRAALAVVFSGFFRDFFAGSAAVGAGARLGAAGGRTAFFGAALRGAGFRADFDAVLRAGAFGAVFFAPFATPAFPDGDLPERAGFAADFFGGAFPAGLFLAGVFFGAVLPAGVFFAGAFLAADFFAGVFLAGVFFAGAFLAGLFFAGAFFAPAFFAGVFFAGDLLADRAGVFFAGAFLAVFPDAFLGASLRAADLRVAAFFGADFFVALAFSAGRAEPLAVALRLPAAPGFRDFIARVGRTLATRLVDPCFVPQASTAIDTSGAGRPLWGR